MHESERVAPRNTLEGTRAFGQLRREFFRTFLSSYVQGGPDHEFGFVRDAFSDEVLARLAEGIFDRALETPLAFTDNLPDRIYAATMTFSDGSIVIALNARMKVDPEYLAHTLIEELMHVQQIIDGVDFASERHLPYGVRKYEREAKRFATDVLGYEPLTDEAVKRRPEPTDSLYIEREEPA